jgi:hypothetical protein
MVVVADGAPLQVSAAATDGSNLTREGATQPAVCWARSTEVAPSLSGKRIYDEHAIGKCHTVCALALDP